MNGIPKFAVVMRDGAVHTSEVCTWRDLARERTVHAFEGTKTVLACADARAVTIRHEHLATSMEVPEGYEVYHAIRSEAMFMSNGEHKQQIVGSVVGLIKDETIVEERMLDLRANEVVGLTCL